MKNEDSTGVAGANAGEASRVVVEEEEEEEEEEDEEEGDGADEEVEEEETVISGYEERVLQVEEMVITRAGVVHFVTDQRLIPFLI